MDSEAVNIKGISLSHRIYKRLPFIKMMHIKAVMIAIFEELWNELKINGKIKIYNFGTLKLVTNAPSAVPGCWGSEPYIREQRNRLSFILDDDLKEYLCIKLDLNKTFDMSIKELFPQKKPKLENP